MANVTMTSTDAYVGEAIFIEANFDSVVKTTTFHVDWEFGSFSGSFESAFDVSARGTRWSYRYWKLPLEFYNEMTTTTSRTGILNLTVLGERNIVVATASCTFIARVNTSANAPTISVPSVSDANGAIVGLTGDSSIIVRHVSNPRITFNVSARNSAYIAETYVTNDGNKKWGTDVTFKAAPSTIFHVYTRDSRGLQTSITYEIPDDRVIEYIKLTCNIGNERPDTSGNIRLTCAGNYFSDSFGVIDNELTVECRYRVKDGEWGAWYPMDARTSGNTYTASASLSGFAYTTTYEFECRATDAAMSVSSTADARALPNFHWGENDFVHETPVDFRAGIMFNGVAGDYIEEQGTRDIWTYRKWHSGLAECWGMISKTMSPSDWAKWGAMYEAEIVTGYDYPFPFIETPKEYGSILGTTGAMVETTIWGLSQYTTGSYYAVRASETNTTQSFGLYLYVVGRWK
jgi:hypothetical protein